MLCFGGFIVVHEQIFDAFAIGLVKTFSCQFASDGLDGDIRANKVLVNHYPTDKPESQRVLVHTNKDAVSLTDRDGLFIGVDFYLPRSENIRRISISQQ